MAKKKLYYRIDFVNCDSIDYDYTIVSGHNDIEDYLSMLMDEGDLNKKDASITITGVKMTDVQYYRFIESIEK